jgi:cytochrome P450
MAKIEQELTTADGVPVVDFDPAWGQSRLVGESMAAYDELRERCPVMLRSNVGPKGFWLVTSGEAIREAFQRPEVFSNKKASWFDPDPSYNWIPEMIDAPEHTRWRQLLSPFFSPKRMAAMEDKVRERAVTLIDSLKDRGQIDYVRDFSQEYPTSIFLDLMGVSRDLLRTFMQWEDDILHTGFDAAGFATQARAMNDVTAMFAELMEEKRRNPGDDLISRSLTWEMDGQPIPEEDLLGFCLLMFMAGLDTVTNMLAYSTYYLATHQDDRARIVSDSSLIPAAVEEFLRYYAIVTPGRGVLEDTELMGCPFKKGDIVSLPLVSANRDPRLFPDAEKVIIDRADNSHIGFGAGPHRCLGSHLARREMRIALEEWHRRIPAYRLQDGARIEEYIGMQMGMKTLPIEWDV